MGWLDRPDLTGLLWGGLYAFLGSLVPVLFIVFAYKTGRVSDLHMSNPQERQIPYLIGLAVTGVAWLLVRRYAMSPLLEDLILCHIAVMIGLTAWNYFQLVSAHIASLTAIALYTGAAIGPAAGLLLSPVVALMIYIRYFLKRHTRGELVLGLVTGIAAFGLLGLLGAFRP
jgi:hypothetical protein